MTICLAAIAKEGDNEFIVFATDHMVTTATGQFEHTIVKYKHISNNVVAMLAGNPLIFDELIKVGPDLSFENIKKKIFENFKVKRKEIVKNEIFDVYNIDESFFVDCLKSPVPNVYIDMILKQVSEFRLNTGILLVGFDKNVAKITEINENNIADFREMNFHAIGSGNIQAVNTLLFQKHDKCDNLYSTVYNVYKAKRNAEVLQGVGKETELLVLSQSGCVKVSDDKMKTLRDIYETELKFGKEHENLKKMKFNIGDEKCS